MRKNAPPNSLGPTSTSSFSCVDVSLSFPSLPLFWGIVARLGCCFAYLQVLKKKGIFHVPYRGTMIGAALGGGRELARNPLGPGETMDSRLEKKVREGDRVVRPGGMASAVFSDATAMFSLNLPRVVGALFP